MYPYLLCNELEVDLDLCRCVICVAAMLSVGKHSNSSKWCTIESYLELGDNLMEKTHGTMILCLNSNNFMNQQAARESPNIKRNQKKSIKFDLELLSAI